MTVYCDLEMDTETALELLGFLQLHRESTPALAPLFPPCSGSPVEGV